MLNELKFNFIVPTRKILKKFKLKPKMNEWFVDI